MDLKQAKIIMGKNFIGPEELKKMAGRLGIMNPNKSGRIPAVPYSEKLLKKYSKDFILILGAAKIKTGKSVTINRLRAQLGLDQKVKQPCFYNQDWYIKEKFALEAVLSHKWHLIRKQVDQKTRGENPESIKSAVFPSAVLTAFTFFAYYLHTGGEILWKHDFIWCSDKDHNGDRIYTGRYIDPHKINKNGFNIHRHLSIRSCYGLAPEIK